MNSMCQNYPRGDNSNPLFMHSEDMSALALADNELIQIESEDGQIRAAVKKDDRMRKGVVSMAHCFGGFSAAEDNWETVGSNVSQLISTDHDCDPITGMARMSAIPVKLNRIAQ